MSVNKFNKKYDVCSEIKRTPTGEQLLLTSEDGVQQFLQECKDAQRPIYIMTVREYDATVFNPYDANIVECKFVEMEDLEEAQSQMEAVLPECVAWIQRVMQTPRACVLVHCWAGVSRSATVVMAWCMAQFGNTLAEAQAYVLKVRPVVDPNAGFIRALNNFEARLKAAKSPAD